MLEFENQMLLDILNEDGLLVAARGLGLDQVFQSLVKVYSDEGNLVIVIGASPTEEEHCLAQMALSGVSPMPRVVTSDVHVSERESFYLCGGVIFASARILVVDLLKGRVPVDHITGFLVCRAHRILESCQEAFALRLYRQSNKTGFVKSFSNCPEAFTVGFARVERVMRALFARNLLLWPRFHATVASSLNAKKPLLIELHLQLSPLMQQVQCSLLDLMNFTVKELKRINPMMDADELTVENAVSNNFARHVKLNIDPIWHQLSLKSRQLVSDLKTLSFLQRALTQYDCVTYETLVTPLRTMEYAMRSSGWPLLEAAETFFVSSRARVDKLVSPSKEDGSKKAKLDSDVKENRRIPVLEPNPKWEALSEALKEIRTSPSSGVGDPEVTKVLIRVADMRTSRVLKEYLTVGPEVLLTRLYHKAIKENKLSGPKHSTAAVTLDEGKDSSEMLKERASELEVEQVVEEEDVDGVGSVKEGGENAQEEVDEFNGTLTFTLTQQNRLQDEEMREKSPDGKVKSEDVKERDVELVILPTKGKDPYILGRTLASLQPHYVIIYDADISAVRQIEVYQAYHPEYPLHVYFLMYAGSVEEQAYLTSLRKEKESFEHLIQEKATMVVPEEREGRVEDVSNPELDRDLGKSALEACGIGDKGGPSGRMGGGRVEANADPNKRSKVIVDMREFSSELPSIIHRRGMDVEPVTLQVGDYILTKDICVERKSVSDLIGSLQSGRLYNQATAMTRHYERPILLIEFDKDKPFALQGKFYVSMDGRNTDVASKLQLLTLHFPRLRLVWSPSPYATAELFEELKQGREEPNAEEAAVIGLDDGASKMTSSSAPVKFNSGIEDLVAKLPGITSKNLHFILSKGKSLDHLLTLTQAELGDILGNMKSGEALWKGLHNLLQPEKNGPTVNRKGGKRPFRGRGRAR
ncbi:DNA repair endonuclease XPF [Ischnura elegans]|uniref:DNA repair endonuclease XPF n=1 Tax=Ischnura elegans TaxID=197161 RepID=UPI001ED89509|nr:DNA repair endonuclease XPF [Ischnura elegans]